MSTSTLAPQTVTTTEKTAWFVGVIFASVGFVLPLVVAGLGAYRLRHASPPLALALAILGIVTTVLAFGVFRGFHDAATTGGVAA